MSVVIRLMRAGAKKRPFYRMVAADSRRQRDGRFIEILGHYNPIAQPFELVVHKDKVERWIERGAQPSEQAASLLRSLGIAMQKPRTAKPVGDEAPKAKAAKAKPRAKKRVLSERKLRNRATRAKKAAAGPAAKTAKAAKPA
jgi:small subunit ribosomal protein S16